MKRSEMIDEITCVILSHAATYPQFPLENLKTLAVEILKVQESLGMRPPLRDRTEHERKIFGTKEDKFDSSLKKGDWSSENE